MAKFNYRSIAQAVASSPIGAKRVHTVYERKFEEAKKEMLADFDNHPITKEIEAGVGAPNDSGTLGGAGDLFSFIGFEEGSNPVEPVREVLANETVLAESSKKAVAKGEKVTYSFSLRVPTERIRAAAPMPFEEGGRSWVEGVEKGISGFGQYLRGRFASSRSGGGIQVKNTVRATPFTRKKYLTEIFAKFVDKFKK